jgi:hypothetical protein
VVLQNGPVDADAAPIGLFGGGAGGWRSVAIRCAAMSGWRAMCWSGGEDDQVPEAGLSSLALALTLACLVMVG